MDYVGGIDEIGTLLMHVCKHYATHCNVPLLTAYCLHTLLWNTDVNTFSQDGRHTIHLASAARVIPLRLL
jgi:hypothetical protein